MSKQGQATLLYDPLPYDAKAPINGEKIVTFQRFRVDELTWSTNIEFSLPPFAFQCNCHSHKGNAFKASSMSFSRIGRSRSPALRRRDGTRKSMVDAVAMKWQKCRYLHSFCREVCKTMCAENNCLGDIMAD